MMIRISVVVPVYNAAAWIERCARGLLNQDYPQSEYEIIMVDNNSDDNSPLLIREWGGVQLLREAQQGSYAARNKGVQASRGEIVAFTDADCVADRGWLAAIDRGMQNQATQLMLGPRAYNSRGMRLVGAYDDARVEHIFEQRDARKFFGFTNNMAVRRTALERYGPFEQVARGGDTIFLQRLVAAEGTGAAVWNPAMRVTHLELRNGWSYVRKSFVYARARRRTRHLGECRTLGTRECFRIFRKVTDRRSARDTAELMLLLGAGRVTWSLGSLF